MRFTLESARCSNRGSAIDTRYTLNAVNPLSANSAAPGSIEVTCSEAGMPPLRFEKTFRIGRAVECEVRVQNEFVSRFHAEVTPGESGWVVRDLNSSNGLYCHGRRVETVLIERGEGIRL